jgi:hypothetical protein
VLSIGLAFGISALIGVIFYGWIQRHRAAAKDREIQHPHTWKTAADAQARTSQQKPITPESPSGQMDPSLEQPPADKGKLAQEARILAAAGETKRREVSASPDRSSDEFAKRANQLRERALMRLEPMVTPPASQTATGRSPWRSRIMTNLFAIGELVHGKKGGIRQSSAWDPTWQEDFGGTDALEPEARANYVPRSFTPKLNPFYCALPYNDVNAGRTKPESRHVIPWFEAVFQREGESVCGIDGSRFVISAENPALLNGATAGPCAPITIDMFLGLRDHCIRPPD